MAAVVHASFVGQFATAQYRFTSGLATLPVDYIAMGKNIKQLNAATAMLSHLKANPIEVGQLDEMIATWVGENLCRCTGYVRYLDAIRQVALTYVAKHG